MDTYSHGQMVLTTYLLHGTCDTVYHFPRDSPLHCQSAIACHYCHIVSMKSQKRRRMDELDVEDKNYHSLFGSCIQSMLATYRDASVEIIAELRSFISFPL